MTLSMPIRRSAFHCLRPTARPGAVIPFPSPQTTAAQSVLMVEFASADGRTVRAIGGGDTLEAAIAFARESCPAGATWEPSGWTDLYGD